VQGSDLGKVDLYARGGYEPWYVESGLSCFSIDFVEDREVARIQLSREAIRLVDGDPEKAGAWGTGELGGVDKEDLRRRMTGMKRVEVKMREDNMVSFMLIDEQML
jgi:hypothetical protein